MNLWSMSEEIQWKWMIIYDQSMEKVGDKNFNPYKKLELLN